MFFSEFEFEPEFQQNFSTATIDITTWITGLKKNSTAAKYIVMFDNFDVNEFLLICIKKNVKSHSYSEKD